MQINYFNNKPNNPNFKSKKVPNCLYHFTTDTLHKRMMESGSIKCSNLAPAGVYLIDLISFLKDWKRVKARQMGDIRRVLLCTALKGSNDKVVLLRVPTKNIDLNKLRIRSLEVFWDNTTCLGNTKKTAPDQYFNGLPATESRYYRQNHVAVEFICPEDIPLTGVQKVGEVSDKFHSGFQNMPLFDIFYSILQGQPEEKALYTLC